MAGLASPPRNNSLALWKYMYALISFESKSESRSVVSHSLRPHGLYSPWNSPGQNTGAFLFSRGFSQPRDRTQVSHIAGRFFTNWATREAQEYWSGSLSLLQQIFPTQELNQDLLHCRRILFQLSYEGSIYFVLMPAVVCSSLLAATRTKIAGPGLSLTSLVEALWHNTLQSSSRRTLCLCLCLCLNVPAQSLGCVWLFVTP